MPGPEASLCALSVHAALSRLSVPDTSVHATCTGCACCPVLQPLAVVGAHGSRRDEETWTAWATNMLLSRLFPPLLSHSVLHIFLPAPLVPSAGASRRGPCEPLLPV